MKKDFVRFFRYMGSKKHLISNVNEMIKDVDAKVYIEPFVGSGTILFNLEKSFKKYIINDVDKNIISLYKSFQVIDYKDLMIAKEFIQKTFGDIRTNKESYYEYRKYYNDNFHFTDKEERGLYLYFLINSCINSMARFGKMGFNQGFGHRLYLLEEETFSKIKERLKDTEIFSSDYSDYLYNDERILLFLDPPYSETGSSYAQFNEEDQRQFVEKIKDLKSKVIYTDLHNENVLKTLNNWKHTKVSKKIRNVSPQRNKEATSIEIIHYNF